MAEATKTKKTTAKKPATKAKKAPKKAEGLMAVFATGGKQYFVSEGDKLKIEKLPGEHQEGGEVIFDTVLLTTKEGGEVTLGTPFVKGAVVTATIEKIARYKTIDVIKYKQKSRYFKKYGHRQPYFEVKIVSIK